ncbi:hypothetical protein [Bacteroides acidifaciens]|uniref:hypothetical protein n=1 Tax=Bacteroides acidifaciens TaxID=85831 RepID=UPI002446B459|nr:hypothetical protein [Bacteroides acidifaciens]MCE9475913.1 hypothetical protein [Bacteroides fragilis]
MKKHEDIQRFYFFDYLFWIGKNFQYIVGRMDGDCVLLLYLMSVIFLPLESLGFCLFPKNNQTVLFGGIVGLFVCISIMRIIYRKRKKAVMKHYSSRCFNPLVGWIIALLPFAIIGVIFLSLSLIK